MASSTSSKNETVLRLPSEKKSEHEERCDGGKDKFLAWKLFYAA